jgi:prepilin-type N-terminal cleavage/methylation domain-containing protein
MGDKKGFTLIELLVTMIIGTIMIAAIYSMINLTQKSSAGIERRVAAQQDEKTALDLMAMEIRMASFNPLYIPDSQLWLNTYCSALSSHSDYKGIQEATKNSITIQMDINENGSVSDSNEVIKYEYIPNSLYIKRGTRCGYGYSFLGAREYSGATRNVRVINNSFDPVIPVFRYYNGNGAEITEAMASDYSSPTTGIPAIRRILITLVVETEKPDLTTAKRKVMVYSTSVIVRNHAPKVKI